MRSRTLLIIFTLCIVVTGSVLAYHFLQPQQKVGAGNQQPQIFTNTDQPAVQPVAAPQPAAQPATDTFLEVVRGTVQLTTGGVQEVLTPASESATLQPSDIVHTGADTVATVDYQDGTVIRMAPNTTMTIKEKAGLSPASTVEKIQESVGTIYVRFRKIVGLREGLEVETPSVVAAVRGTKFNLSVAGDKESKLVVMEHVVEVKEKDPKSGEVKEDSANSVGEQQQMKSAVFKKVKKHLLIGKLLLEDHEKEWFEFNTRADAVPEVGGSESSDQTASGAAEASPAARLRKYRSQRKILDPMVRDFFKKIGTTTDTTAGLKPITAMPGAGLSRSLVQTSQGQFPITCIGADKNSVRVLTDSGNDDTCQKDCTVMPLDAYARRNGAFAAINGSYFCPPDYPQCADKKNSFDTLFFNARSHKYLNSDNNVYSVLPFFVVDGGGNPRFISKTLQWGRDTGINAGIAGNPLLVRDGHSVVGEYSLDDKQRTVKGPRGAVVQKGNMLYLCMVSRISVYDSAEVYATLGADNAMNIDGGGSTALWLNGQYLLGPGRQLPTALMFIHR